MKVTKLNNNINISVTLDNEIYEITKEMVEIRISSKEGFNVGMSSNDFIILNTELNETFNIRR